MARRQGLTARQLKVLKFIRFYIDAEGHSPSYEDIQLHLKIKSKSGVFSIVKGLVRRGYLGQAPGARNLWVI